MAARPNRDVAFLCSSYGTGGMETCLNALAKELVKHGFGVNFILGELRKEHVPFPEKVNVYVLNEYIIPHRRTFNSMASSFFRARRKLARIIHLNPMSAFICMDMYPAWLCLSLKLRPLFLWLNFSVNRVFVTSKTWIVNRFVIKTADALIVPSKSMKEELYELFKGMVAPKTFHILNPLAISRYGVESLYSPGCKRFVYVGRLVNKQKRIDRMLKAFSLLENSNWELFIVGDGSDKEYLLNLAKLFGIDKRIGWAGWQSNPWGYIKEKGGAEALLFTSDYEGYGNVLVEAMANGIPCVAVDCPTGPRDIIRDGVNGILIPLTSDEEIVQRLSEVLKGFLDGVFVFDEEKIKNSVVENDPSVVVEKWIDLIEKYQA